MRTRLLPLCSLFVGLIAIVSMTSQSLAEDARIVFLAGKLSHGYGAHEHLAGCRILAEAIENSTEGVRCEV